MTVFEPIPSESRLRSLDVVRGAALLGILLMNILSFGLPMAAYNNPTLWGGSDGPNLVAFAIQWIFFEGKMRALFSLMFGAAIVAFMSRAILRDNGVGAADIYCRRMLWLMVFGALHGWLIWHGDILYAYGLWGLLLLPLRNAPPKALFTAAAIGLMAAQAFLTLTGLHHRSTRDAAVAARAAEAQGAVLTGDQKKAMQAWDAVYNATHPSMDTLQEEIDDYRGGYVATLWRRAPMVRDMNSGPVYFPMAGDIWGMMLVGMGLFNLGVLQGARPPRFYVRMAIICYGIGIPLNALSAYGMISSQFELIAIYLWNAPHELARAAVALGHAAVLILLARAHHLDWLTARLAAVGRMALSNYIATSVICVLLFYVPGLGLMGQLQRYQLYYVVAGIWLVNVAWSPWWLARYRFGPLEWCWRSLAYWERQPMRRQDPVRRESARPDAEIAEPAPGPRRIDSAGVLRQDSRTWRAR